MRTLAAVLVPLLVAWNVYLAVRLQAMSDLRRTLAAERADLLEGREVARAASEERSALASVLEEYRRRDGNGASSEELGIARLRDELLAAERGLDLDRLSLEFRPEEPVGPTILSRVQATMRGSYRDLFDYLGRVEARRLPLAPAELSFRKESDGSVSLSIRWVAAWPRDPRSEGARELSPSELDVQRLSRWLRRDDATASGRDPFALALGSRDRPAPAAAALPPPAEPAPPEPPPVEAPERPRLTGFVLARPELEPDVDRRVLAALRFGGELHLVEIGDALGEYRVDEVRARESVTLRHEPTGERFFLRLE